MKSTVPPATTVVDAVSALGVPEWTDEQNRVITAPPNCRILVDAGPGTGKTAVACARVAWLIDHAALEPTQIWMVSFTRTAVHEIRGRIGTYLADPLRALGIRIATIDAHAWAIQSGFNSDAALTGSYEDNIRNVIGLIQGNEGVFEYLATVRHLFIDEAQDVVGPRVELLLELMNALPEDAGVTVLADEAQGIYGFSEDEKHGEIDGSLPESIREYMGDAFTELELTKIHRTSDPALGDLFLEGRMLLRKSKSKPEKALQRVRELIQKRNHGDLGGHRDDLQNLPKDLDDTFLLFRRRGEALEASGYLALRPHRLRMSGLPPVVHEWIGRLFWDWREPDISKSTFEKLWLERMKNRPGPGTDAAWKCLVRLVGHSHTSVSVQLLAQRLSRGAPPIDLCLPDFGFEGPVVGTIHGAKGREAGRVRLYLPPEPAEGRTVKSDEILEEARVLFVGASRAREELRVGRGATMVIAKRLETSGRAYTPYLYSRGTKQARAAVEIGRTGDLDAAGLVGRSFFTSEAAAKSAQKRIAALSGGMSAATATACGPELGWAYAVAVDAEPKAPFAFLSQQVNHDLFEIAKKVDGIVHMNRKRPPAKLPYMKVLGVRTVAVGPDDPVRETLHSPWRDSGFVLAPVLIGYGMAYFRY